MRFCILILLVIGVTDQAKSFRGLRKKGTKNYNTIPDHSNMRIIKKVNGFQELIGNSGSSEMLATCDLVFFSETVDFDTAEARCNNFTLGSNQEGHLATVNDKEKNEALKILLNMAYPNQPTSKKDLMWGPENWVWAGLRKFQNLDKEKYESEDWKWADESIPKRFNKWYNRKQPDQAKLKPGKEGCPADGEVCLQNQMRINSEGLWDDTYKFKKHPYACDYQGKYILSTDRVHFWEAKKRCEATGLYMAQITTEADYEELVTAARYFLGEPKAGKWTDGNWFWMGAADVMHEGNWTWIYNSRDVTLKSEWWEDDMPDDSGSQDGLALSIAGKFDDQDMKKKNAIACQCSPPINGGWSDYDPDWSVCPDTCGEHEQTKSRTCTNPAPANGGNDCVGDASLTQLCKTKDCSDDLAASCDFENGMCNLRNVPSDDHFDWSLNSGSTDSTRTGPIGDHTTNTTLGHYIYIETSSPRTPGQKAILETSWMVLNNDNCHIFFWYHMYGIEMGSLEFKQITDNSGQSRTDLLLQKSGNQGDRWREANLPVHVSSPIERVKFQFIGEVGSGYEADIAIDDIVYDNCDVQMLN